MTTDDDGYFFLMLKAIGSVAAQVSMPSGKRLEGQTIKHQCVAVQRIAAAISPTRSIPWVGPLPDAAHSKAVRHRM